MSFYCNQVSYTTNSWAHLVRNPDDRLTAVRAPLERLGGTIHALFFSSGPYDVPAITEFPDNITASHIAAAFADGGAVARIQSTHLLSFAEVSDPDHFSAASHAEASGSLSATTESIKALAAHG